jgi:hypothetical protein
MELKNIYHSVGKWYLIKDLTVAIWNVRGINHRVDEIDKDLKSRKINIAVISLTKDKNKGSK